MSKIAMFGGSFNPVHKGHTGLVSRMIERFSLDTVYVIPTFKTPLKDNTPMITPEHRLNMCSLAFSDMDNVIVSDMEIQRGGNSYTVDTLMELKSLHPHSELYLIIGADSFMQLPLWHDVSAVLSLATILTVSRGEIDAVQLYAQKKKFEDEYSASVYIVEEPIAPISSTNVRNAILSGKDYSHLLHSKVSEYITKNRLYAYGHQ